MLGLAFSILQFLGSECSSRPVGLGNPLILPDSSFSGDAQVTDTGDFRSKTWFARLHYTISGFLHDGGTPGIQVNMGIHILLF